MKCIHCENDMVTRELRGIEIDHCPGCYGFWLDGGKLKDLTDYDLSAGRVLSCMKCEIPMQTKYVRGVEIDICPECSSVWLDPRELLKIAEIDMTAGRILQCPVCDTQLQTKMLKGVEVDICPECSGVFFDKGEVEKITALEMESGEITVVSEFLHEASQQRIDIAILLYKDGVKSKGEAADIAGISLEEFESLLKD